MDISPSNEKMVRFKDSVQERGESSKTISSSVHDDMAQIYSLSDHVDDCFLALAAGDDLLVFGNEEDSYPVVDDAAFADELQLQEVILASCVKIDSMPERSESKKPNAQLFSCEICMENKPETDLFEIDKCDHSYCFECLSGYIESKVEENITTIKCPDPGCASGILELELCRKFVKMEVCDRWGTKLCESAINEATKFYCPFKDCSTLLILESDDDVEQAECPHCHRMFCAKCRVTWHVGIGCVDFQKLPEGDRGREDRMLMQLAKESKWQRCPACKFFVEKIDGCLFIKCRCGYSFCYGCATKMTKDHYCPKCKR